jgi:hypothetical protein
MTTSSKKHDQGAYQQERTDSDWLVKPDTIEPSKKTAGSEIAYHNPMVHAKRHGLLL